MEEIVFSFFLFPSLLTLSFCFHNENFHWFFGWKKVSGIILTGSKRKKRGKKKERERRRKSWKPINVSKRTRYIFNQGVNQVIKREENEWKERERIERERRRREKEPNFLSNYIDDKRRMTNKLEEMKKLLIASKIEREKNIFL